MDVLEGSSLKFSGQIYVNKHTNFGYFAMNTTDVRSKLADIIHMLNVNRKKKRISGTIFMCRFSNHNGIGILFICSCDIVWIY